MKFSVAFQESNYTVNGSNILHAVMTSDTAADASHQFTFNLTLKTSNSEYSNTWTSLLPSGSKSVTVPYVVPMAWSNDFDTVDMNGYNGFISATLTVTYLLTINEKQYTTTYSGYYATLPVYVDASVMPSVGTLTYTAVDSKVPSAWGCLVQGQSIVRVSAPNAAGAYGSDIYYYYFNGGTAQMQNYADISLQTAGNITIPVTIEDSRGRMVTADLYLVVQPYAAPTLSQISSQRCSADGTLSEEGAYFHASGEVAGYTVSSKNTVNVSVAWKKVTASNYGSAISVSMSAGQVINAQLEEGASYDIKYTISDTFYTITYYDYLSSTTYLMHFLKGGAGIAVGKAAEQENLFDVALNTTLRRDLVVGGDATITGDLILGGTEVGTALQSLQEPLESQFTMNTTNFPASNVYMNKIVRCGRVITYSFKGMLNSSEPKAGERYVLGSIPAGYYSADFLPQLNVLLNGQYNCVVSISSTGQVTVTLSESYMQTIWINGTSIVID